MSAITVEAPAYTTNDTELVLSEVICEPCDIDGSVKIVCLYGADVLLSSLNFAVDRVGSWNLVARYCDTDKGEAIAEARQNPAFYELLDAGINHTLQATGKIGEHGIKDSAWVQRLPGLNNEGIPFGIVPGDKEADQATRDYTHNILTASLRRFKDLPSPSPQDVRRLGSADLYRTSLNHYRSIVAKNIIPSSTRLETTVS